MVEYQFQKGQELYLPHTLQYSEHLGEHTNRCSENISCRHECLRFLPYPLPTEGTSIPFPQKAVEGSGGSGVRNPDSKPSPAILFAGVLPRCAILHREGKAGGIRSKEMALQRLHREKKKL